MEALYLQYYRKRVKSRKVDILNFLQDVLPPILSQEIQGYVGVDVNSVLRCPLLAFFHDILAPSFLSAEEILLLTGNFICVYNWVTDVRKILATVPQGTWRFARPQSPEATM